VDIDAQAVEVAKLSLLLKVLDGETDESLCKQHQRQLFEDRALPNLADNIRCGNSLIGPDYFHGRLIPDSDEIQRINAFDWERSFPDAMCAGGFDCVIGNPPWGGDIDKHLDYFHETYPATTQEHTDSFKLFIEQAVRLLSSGGLAAMIVPNTLLRQTRLRDVRIHLMDNRILARIDLGQNVFKKVVAPSCIFVVERTNVTPSHRVLVTDLSPLSNEQKAEVLGNGGPTGDLVRQADFCRNPHQEWIAISKQKRVSTVLLGDFPELQCRDAGINYQRVGSGMQDKGKSDLADRLLYEGKRENASHKMYWKGADIERYWMVDSTNRFCRPNYRQFVRANEVVRLNAKVYETVPKILLRQTADRPIAALDHQGVWFGRSIIAILLAPNSVYKAEYFLGILNSKYFQWRYDQLVGEKSRAFAQVKLGKIKQLPIRVLDFSKAAEKAMHDRMVKLVETITAFRNRLSAAKSDAQEEALRRQIDATDAEIDRIVYDLYGLTKTEIAVVEAENRA